MTDTPPPIRPPLPTAEYRWTQPKALAFIAALAQHGKVAAAARAVGMTRQSAYRLRERVPQVAEIWQRAQATGRARRRSRDSGGKATLSPSQGDTSGAQGAGSRGQGDTFGPQGDGFESFVLGHGPLCQLRAASPPARG